MISISQVHYELEKIREGARSTLKKHQENIKQLQAENTAKQSQIDYLMRAQEANWADVERLQKENASMEKKMYCLLRENHLKDERIVTLEKQILKFGPESSNKKEQMSSSLTKKALLCCSRRFSSKGNNMPPETHKIFFNT
uniref:Uncharacterized protein n=1 Tax=Ditylum brightwellii TaxID=49249 RepID=A0A7S4SZQ9_9STRA|mmetsp:Transcript_2545/g.2831  ORF Transcript_2545/g.2831 Transcript_2545/m.2831 type:complete len:141 (-) Transcript_2545:590-1012(-)